MATMNAPGRFNLMMAQIHFNRIRAPPGHPHGRGV
jgi:hypothetical protein